MRHQRIEPPAILNGQEAAKSFFASCFDAGRDAQERLWVAHVDSSARCLHVECYDGQLESIELPVRNIIVDAAKLGSAGVVLAHNHPGGDATPSKADCAATRKLIRVSEAIDLTILDHLIFAGNDCTSMRRMGLL
ncbi:DNA repair protein [Sphingomonas sp. NSE70-1]|uniref:DNA repair protein n=1 Tax=Sphingomonas caseinilyticus TaxID=2908205 RepID=A0ABT0RXR3_9SPHN|nr:JAB domain-containing protein [Sphingomonas caseinilyticus]MCL6699793.1 DNA repair protein [Sphingomonas caseinilyticus]